jgi:arylsulfatase A-like enzyme
MNTLGDQSYTENSNRTALLTFCWTLVLGVFWMLIEFSQIFSASTLFDFPTDFARFLRYLPWQLAIFAGIGLPIALLARSTRVRSGGLSWLRFGVALLAFIGPPAALGAYRASRSPIQAIVVGMAVAASIGLILLVLAGLGRLLPGRFRGAWPAACVIGGSFAMVPLMSRASAPLRLDSLPVSKLFTMLEPSDWIAGSIALLVSLAILAWFQPKTRAAITALSILLGLIGSGAIDAAPGGASTNSAKPDVIIILIDALRADAVGASRNGESLTPNIDAIAAESIVFKRAYSAANRTKHSMPAIMTSLSADVVGEALAEDATTLGEYLNADGYGTYGISTNPHLSGFYGYDQGFERFHDPTIAPDYLVMNPLTFLAQLFPAAAYHQGWISAQLYYAPASEVRSRAAGILRDAESPRFIYLHLMDLHGPYLPPKENLAPEYQPDDFLTYFDLLARSSKGELNPEGERLALSNARHRYEGELRYADREIGRIIQYLRDAGRWEEALVWILSDHGEAFGEHDWFGHSGSNVFSTLLHVPMIMKPPRSSGIEPAIIDTPVSTFDVLPTTLASIGIESALDVFGVDLHDLVQGDSIEQPRSIISDSYHPDGRLMSAIEGPWQLVALRPRDTTDIEPRALYRLDRDPTTKTNLLGDHPEVEERLAAALSRRYAEEQRLSLRAKPKQVDPEMLERLRSLGYIDE